MILKIHDLKVSDDEKEFDMTISQLEKRKSIITKYEKLFVLVFFIVIAFLYLGANIFSGEIVAPMDGLFIYSGWIESSVTRPPVFNLERTDILDARLPSWISISESVKNGENPIWDPLRSLGSSNYVPAIFFNVDFLLFFIFGKGLGFTLGLVGKIVIAGFGTYLLCREKLGIIPSIFAGITFMMLGPMAGWLMWPHVMVAVWVPWVLWSIQKVVYSPTAIRMMILSITLFLLIIGGFPFLTVIGIYLAIAFFFWTLFLNYKTTKKLFVKKFSYTLLGGIFGIMLSSIYLIPFMEYTDQVDTSWRQGGNWLNSQDLEVLWNPTKYSRNFVPSVEQTGYVGILALALLPFTAIGFFKKHIFSKFSSLFWISVLFICIILAFDFIPISSFLYQFFPFDSNPANRMLFFVGFSIAILSGMGLHHLLELIRKSTKKLKIKKLKMVAILVGLVILFVQIIDVSVVGRSTNAVVPSETFYPPTPSLNYVQQHLLPGQNVIATNAYMVGGTLSAYNIPEIFSHGYYSKQEKSILDNLVSNPWATPTAPVLNANKININSEYMDAFFVRYILFDSSVLNDRKFPKKWGEFPEKWEMIQVSNNISILENKKVPPGAYIIPETMVGKSFDSSSIITDGIIIDKFTNTYRKYFITNEQQGLLVVPLRVWPGWNAYVNGEHIEISPYLDYLSSVELKTLQAINGPIDDGNPQSSAGWAEYVVEFKYEPQSFLLGGILSVFDKKKIFYTHKE